MQQVRTELARRKKETGILRAGVKEIKDEANPGKDSAEEEEFRAREIAKAQLKLDDYIAAYPTTMKALFANLDSDGNNYLDRVEWLEGLQSLNVQLNREEIELTFGLFDDNQDGQMSYAEFTKIIANDSIKDDTNVGGTRGKPNRKGPRPPAGLRRGSQLALRRRSMIEVISMNKPQLLVLVF